MTDANAVAAAAAAAAPAGPDRWTYGSEGTRYPVRPGEVWQCGDHLLVCSDLMASTLLDRILAGADVEPTLVYSDPPWGQALLNGFRTKAGLTKAAHTWQDLYRRVAGIAQEYGVPVWVEGSAITSRDGQQIPPLLVVDQPAYRHWQHVEITYYRRHRAGLYYAGPGPLPAHLLALLSGRDDEAVPSLVLAYYSTVPRDERRRRLVVDPCAGRGLTSRAAYSAGWSSLTNEVNPRRMSAALVRLSRLVGAPPVRVEIGRSGGTVGR